MVSLRRWLLTLRLVLEVAWASQLRSRSFVYDYSKHGQEWLQGTCASRSRQSPIDLPAAQDAVPTANFEFTYDRVSAPFVISNTGHTLSADMRDQGYGGVSYGGAWYDIMYINMHALSEHTFGGVHKPVELHLVHKRYDSDALLIVAVPLDSETPPPQGGEPLPAGGSYSPPPPGEVNSNPVVQALLREAPPPPLMKMKIPGDEVSGPLLTELMQGAQFYGYAGSTTAPPCAENVVWLVRSAPVLASDTQLRYLHDALFGATSGFGNYRATMPLEGREIILYSAIEQVSPSVAADSMAYVASPSSQVDREYQAKKDARDALKLAKESLDFVRTLGRASKAGAPAPAPAPAPMGVERTVSPEEAAIGMASIVAQAAKAAIKDASKEIATKAHEAAIAAAKDASQIVLKSLNPQGQPILPPGAAVPASVAPPVAPP